MDEVNVVVHSQPTVTTWQKARFSTAISSYRIFRLSLELFLVEHVVASGYRVSTAGIIFLIYSLADFFGALFFLWFPTICFGSTPRALIFFCMSVGSLSLGFIGLYLSTEFWAMATCASLFGVGAALWFVNYQTLTNTSFIKLDQIARIRQAFECIGFLLPSICLAIVNSVSSDSGSVTRYSATILGAVGVCFYLVSADVVIISAAHLDRDIITRQEESVMQTVKSFFKSSVFKYFVLNSILLAASNIAFATMSVITEQYFGLKPTYLWLAAIGFPIGGMISVAAALKTGSDRDSKTRVLSGCVGMVLVFCVMIGVSPVIVEGPARQEQIAKAGLFVFGLAIGSLYSDTYSSAFALWLDKLKKFSPGFVARANVFHSSGAQAIMAGFFQVQTIFIDVTQSKDTSTTVQALVFFGPLIALLAASILVVKRIPYPKDKKFGWPFSPPYPRAFIFCLRVLKLVAPNDYEAFVFGKFCDWRTSHFSSHLDFSIVQGGPKCAKTARLIPSDFRTYLQTFDELGTEEQHWEVKGTLQNMLLSNDSAFEKRIELIQRAKSSIWVVTWSLSGIIGSKIANELIQRHNQGVKVCVMLDAVNLRYLEEKHKLDHQPCVCRETLLKLLRAGVQVKMLSTLYEEKDPAYMIGSHRKILLVDDRWLLTGGRNTADAYAASEETSGLVYHDADVVLEGSFVESTGELLENLWKGARSATQAFKVGLSSKDVDKTGHLDDSVTSVAVEIEDEELKTDNGVDNHSHHDDSVPSLMVEIDSYKEEEVKTVSESNVKSNCMTHTSNNQTGQEGFFHHVSARSRLDVGREVTIFQLDHKGGNIDGHDIVLSSLTFLIETAETRVDLVFGYFQLFEPPLKRAIANAVSRGVKIRLITNSSDTNDVFFFNPIFQRAFAKLLGLGVEVYVPATIRGEPILSEQEQGHYLCLHYKMALVDSRVLMIGSWNAMGSSVFYDSEFTAVLFDSSSTDGASFKPVEQFIEESIEHKRFVKMETCPEEWKMPQMARLWLLLNGKTRKVARGF